jgi:hypothetical protein
MEPKSPTVRGKYRERRGEEDNVDALTRDQCKTLVLKTDLVVMSLAIICMTVAFLDNVGYSADLFCLLH